MGWPFESAEHSHQNLELVNALLEGRSPVLRVVLDDPGSFCRFFRFRLARFRSSFRTAGRTFGLRIREGRRAETNDQQQQNRSLGGEANHGRSRAAGLRAEGLLGGALLRTPDCYTLMTQGGSEGSPSACRGSMYDGLPRQSTAPNKWGLGSTWLCVWPSSRERSKLPMRR